MISLRPQSVLKVGEKLKFDEKEFVFSKDLFVASKKYDFEDYQDTLTDYGSDSDDIEFLLEYPWYHRCRLFKHNKVFVDYEWEEETQLMEEKALNPKDERLSDDNYEDI